MNIRKPNKYCRLYGIEIEFEKILTDPEVRLFHIYLRIVIWDPKHTEIFGSSDLSIRQLKRNYLPKWSVGKVGYTRQSLIKKGWLEHKEGGRIGVKNYLVYRLNVQQAEQLVQQMRQGVQITEQLVQASGKVNEAGLKQLRDVKAPLREKLLFSSNTLDNRRF